MIILISKTELCLWMLSRTIKAGVMLLIALGFGGLANAQGRPAASDGWKVSVGAGLLSTPNYLGDDRNQTLLVPSVRATFSNTWILSAREGVQYTFNPEQSLQYGVALVPDFGRTEDDDNPFRISGDGNDDLQGLEDVDTQAAFRVFTKYSLGAWSINASVNQTFTGDDRRQFALGLNRSGIVMTGGPPLIVSGGFGLRFGNSSTMQALVGVNPEEARITNLNPYRPSAGLISYGINSAFILPLTRSMSVLTTLSVQRVGDEIENSSLVSERGDPLQLTAGLIFNYKLGAQGAR